MYSIYMQGGMKSAISADESAKPDDSRTVLFVPDTPLSFRAMGLWSLALFENITNQVQPSVALTKPIFTPNERNMSADSNSKRMLSVSDILPGLGVIVA